MKDRKTTLPPAPRPVGAPDSDKARRAPVGAPPAVGGSRTIEELEALARKANRPARGADPAPAPAPATHDTTTAAAITPSRD